MYMRMTPKLANVLVAAALCAPSLALSQVTPAPTPAPPPAPAAATGPAPGANGPQVGSVAPDFTLPGATRYGRLQNPVKLSDYRGETVVLAFFFQARSKG
jgi:hypothetical protein